MDQPVPQVTDEDVRRIALRDFGAEDAPLALAVLAEYGKQGLGGPGSPRVRLAILKLADGDLRRLAEHTAMAIRDCRDVLAWAEYPRWSREIGLSRADAGTEREVVKDDWAQYREWLERGAGEPR